MRRVESLAQRVQKMHKLWHSKNKQTNKKPCKTGLEIVEWNGYEHEPWKCAHFDHLCPFSHTCKSHLCNNQFVLCFLWVHLFEIPHISEMIQYLSFSAWLISFSIMPSRIIHVVPYVKSSFFYGWIIFHCVYIPHFLIHSFISGHLGRFHILALVNNASINMRSADNSSVYSMVTLANNAILYIWTIKLLVTHKSVTMWVDGCVNQPYCGDHFTIYTYTKWSPWIFKPSMLLNINYVSTNLCWDKLCLTR